MSIRKLLTPKNITIFTAIIVVITALQIFSPQTKKPPSITEPLISENTSPKSVFDTSETPSTQIEAILREYQFMFYHIPQTEDVTSLGWDKDAPLIVQRNNIINMLNYKSIKNLPSNSITILNNLGEALIINGDSSTLFKNKTETPLSEKDRDVFSYLWFQKPLTNVILSSDKKTIYLNNASNNESIAVFTSESEINPFSISTNNTQISFTDKKNLYLVTPNKETKTTKLSDTTIESITFWLKNDLFLIEKVEIPRLLDFVMYVNPNDLSFNQIITSSSLINRMDLNVHPAINQKQDMVLFKEIGGLIWILSKDQAITRIYPRLKLPPEMWDKSY